jgi:HK97 family phage prohead protease
MEKSAGIPIEFKDLDRTSGTGVIRHSVYNSIDRVNDIATKGMFTKSWNEAKAKGLTKSINLLFNHNTRIGFVTDVYDDDSGGYTSFKLLKSKVQDISEMADEGALTGASFGYIPVKKQFIEVKGQKVRKLLEVKHLETSLLDVEPAHPEAGIVILNKSLDDITEDDINELITWGGEHITSLKDYVQKIDAYCRKAKASDETITTLQNSLTECKKLISDYDTAITQLATEPVASDEERTITNFLNSLKMQSWTQKHLNNSLPT